MDYVLDLVAAAQGHPLGANFVHFFRAAAATALAAFAFASIAPASAAATP